MLSTSVVASIMDRIGQSTLELLWNSLLNTLGDDRGITPVLRVGLTTSVGSSIVDLNVSTYIANNLSFSDQLTLLGRLSSRP